MASAPTVARLEPFLLMAKSAKGAAAAKLIENATSAPGVFVFAELLDSPNIQQLSTNSQQLPYLNLLKIFSYGTYSDYKQNQTSLPPLNDAQVNKLKQLSIITFSADRRILPYSQLMSLLDIPSIRALEDLIIDAIYAELIRGKLDQKGQQFEVQYTLGRDLRPGQLEDLLGALRDWSNRTASVLGALDTKLSEIENTEKQKRDYLAAYDLNRQATINEILIAQQQHAISTQTHHHQTKPASVSLAGGGVLPPSAIPTGGAISPASLNTATAMGSARRSALSNVGGSGLQTQNVGNAHTRGRTQQQTPSPTGDEMDVDPPPPPQTPSKETSSRKKPSTSSTAASGSAVRKRTRNGQ